MRHAPPTSLRRVGLAAAALAALLLAGCGSRTTSSTGAPTAGHGAPTPPVAPSGDSDLDKLDTDLSAFEQENHGLDQAVVATKEG